MSNRLGHPNKKSTRKRNIFRLLFIVSTFICIKDKDITSYQLLLIKQDRVLVN